MDVREKLVELIAQKVCETWSGTCDQWLPHDCGKCYANDCHISEIADYLISNGVTVQEWIPFKDRLPEAGGYVVCIAKRNPFSIFMPMAARIDRNGWVNPITEQYISEVTHWMPLPEPPKGARMDGDSDAKAD